MKKIFLCILCFCVILSLLTVNCFALTVGSYSSDSELVSGFGPTNFICSLYGSIITPGTDFDFAFDSLYPPYPLTSELYTETQSGEFWSSYQSFQGGRNFVTNIFTSNFEGTSLTFSDPTFYFTKPFILNSDTNGVLWTFHAHNISLDDYREVIGSLSFGYSYYDSNGILRSSQSSSISLSGSYSSEGVIDAPIPNIIKANIPNYNAYSTVYIDSLVVTLDPVSFDGFEGFDDCGFSCPANPGVEYASFPDSITIVEEVVNPNILQWVVTSLNSFFDVSIFGDITIGNIFGIALAVPLVLWFLKLFAGG